MKRLEHRLPISEQRSRRKKRAGVNADTGFGRLTRVAAGRVGLEEISSREDAGCGEGICQGRGLVWFGRGEMRGRSTLTREITRFLKRELNFDPGVLAWM